MCQITCRKKHTPQIFYTFINFIIGKLRHDILFNPFARNQSFYFISGRNIRLIYKSAYNGVSAGIGPEILRSGGRIIPELICIINYIPRTVNVRVTEMVTIIPFLYLIKMRSQIIIIQNFLYLRIRKPKLLIKSGIQNRQHLKIIKPCKNTLFGNTQAPCQNGKL